MEIFGINLSKKKSDPKKATKDISIVPPSSDDGSTIITTAPGAANYYGLVLDMDSIIKNENDLIRRYREIAQYSDCDSAITDIVNETIITDDDKSIEIKLDNLKISDSIKKKIQDEFEEVLKLLDFEEFGPDIFRQWYIDGRVYYQVLIDTNNVKNGIIELRKIDPRKIRKIKNVTKQRNSKGIEVVSNVEEFYLYNDKGISEQTAQGVKMTLDSVIYCPSGMIDPNTGITIGHLHKAIKPTNQLKMVEDAVVIYRISRAPERRIFYIDVGNLPKLKAEQYVNDIMNKFRNKIVYDATTGETRDDRRHLCLSMDTKVPLLDGRVLTLREISEEYKTNELWAYSCDPITGKFVPGLITWAGVSRPIAEIMRITLDNGKTIDCTPDHKFPVWDKNLVQAKDLVVGDSMIPLYRRNYNITSGKSKDYEQIWDNKDKDWKFTHRLVSTWKDEVGIDNYFLFNEEYANSTSKTVHHKNINRFDNSPNNLVRMHSKDHIAYHRHASSMSGKIGGKRAYELGVGFHNKSHPDYYNWHAKAGTIGGRISSDTGKSHENRAKGRSIFAQYMTDSGYNEWFRQQQRDDWTKEKREIASGHAKRNELSSRGNAAQKEQWKTKERQDRHHKMYAVEYSDSMFAIVKECAYKKMTISQTLVELNRSGMIIEQWKLLNKNKSISPMQKTFDAFTTHDISKIVSKFGNTTFSKLKQQSEFRNHKITKIEYLQERVDTGCLTIDGDEIYHNYHTFALDAGIYTQNSMMEDFWMPRREGGKGTEITTLPGGQTLGQIDDIQYFQNKLYQALNVPLGRLQPQQGFSLGRSSEITREEIKFNKFITRLRKKFSNLLSDALKVQLICKGIIREDEWFDIKQDIHFDFQKDNYFAELKNNEVLMTRLAALQQIDPYVGKYYSVEWVQKNVLDQSEDDIKEMSKQNKENPVTPEDQDQGQQQ